MEINVGEYVRNNNGYIGKILDFCKCEECERRKFYEPILDTKKFYITNLDKECNFEGLKFSPNIIDLIEVGDYVNGERVLHKFDNEFGKGVVYGYETEDRQIAITLYEENIKSIVTKEQFEAMEYKVGE